MPLYFMIHCCNDVCPFRVGCPDGYLVGKKSGICYKEFRTAMKYGAAAAKCQNAGARVFDSLGHLPL